MTTKKKIMEKKIKSFGYAVLHYASGAVLITDPLDDEDGYRLRADSIEEAYKEMKDAELLTKG